MVDDYWRVVNTGWRFLYLELISIFSHPSVKIRNYAHDKCIVF